MTEQPLGRGLDNVAVRSGDLVVRTATEDPARVAVEAALLRVLAGRGEELGIPVPEPLDVDPVAGVLTYRFLPGTPLLGRDLPAGGARRLGRFLRALHAVDLAQVAHVGLPVEAADPDEWLEGLDDPQVPQPLRERVRAAVPSFAGIRNVLVHNDFGAEHLLADGAALTGVIDWTDAAVGDPAADLALVLRDFGPDALAETLDAYGGPPDPVALQRIWFYARCRALEDLAYGQRHPGAQEYARAARRSLAWLFA